MARSFASGESEEMRTEFRAHSERSVIDISYACRAVVYSSRSGSFDMANWSGSSVVSVTRRPRLKNCGNGFLA